MAGDKFVPTEIRQAGPAELRIAWEDGHVSTYEVAHLRRSCRCAACVDEVTGAQILQPGDVPDDVKPRSVRRVGRYAIHFDWSDGHSSGIYSFDFLRSLCACELCSSEEHGGTPAVEGEG